jgi:hypothetical protein
VAKVLSFSLGDLFLELDRFDGGGVSLGMSDRWAFGEREREMRVTMRESPDRSRGDRHKRNEDDRRTAMEMATVGFLSGARGGGHTDPHVTRAARRDTRAGAKTA